jgi:hypothetical protein
MTQEWPDRRSAAIPPSLTLDIVGISWTPKATTWVSGVVRRYEPARITTA